MQRRVLLMTPPFYRLHKDTYALARYPLSLGYLAGAIRKDTDWDVRAYNCDFTSEYESAQKNAYLTTTGFQNYIKNLKDISAPIWQEIRSAVLEYRPDVIGISAMSQNFASACIIAGLVKQISVSTLVIIGGPHPSMVGAEVLECPDIDISVKGEGEATIVELLNAIQRREGFGSIKGISYREGPRIIDNGPREYIKDLDNLWFPHLTAPEVLKDYERYPKLAFKHVFATRGCPYDCFFCGSRNIWSRKVRFRSAENIAQEIQSLQQAGINSVSFEDDTFGINKAYIEQVCAAILANCPGVKWSSELHVNLAEDSIIALMKKAGCYSISIGVESGNNQILEAMRKNITIERALAACRLVKRYNLELAAFFIVGFPQETEETLKDTLNAMKAVKADWLVYSIFTPYPGTEAYEFCKQSGLIREGFDVSLCNHQSPANYFCSQITLERFRFLLSRIEKIVDQNNSTNMVKLAKKVARLGVKRCTKRIFALSRRTEWVN